MSDSPYVRCPKCPRSVPDHDLVRVSSKLAVCRWCARDMVNVALYLEADAKADVIRDDDFDGVRR